MPVAQDFAQLVKQQADIVRIIGEYLTLKKSGAQNYVGLCPFHGEKSPSFSVHAVRQFYHCFGCHESGDVFSFVQKMDKVGFTEAVKVVAKKCNIPLPKREFATLEEAEENRQRGKLLELHEQATTWFEEQLRGPEGARAREYLTGRGVTAATIAKFRIGYAPDSFNALRDRLQGAAPPEILRLSGLFSAKEQQDGSFGPLYSRFRKRVTFPICNESGRVIAFTARALDSDEKSGPKYMNSPETKLYTKGEVLFNLDKAKQAIRQQNFALLVEGQMDCITAYMAGIQNVLATSGTAFTEVQARLLGRHTKRLFFNFDPDTAGADAAERSINLLIQEKFEIRIVTLEEGLDPDRYIRERGIADYVAAVEAARRHSDYLIDRAMQLFPTRTAEGKSRAWSYLKPYIEQVSDPIVQNDFLADTEQRLGIESALARADLRRSIRRHGNAATQRPRDGLVEAERVLLRAAASPIGSRIFQRLTEALASQVETFESLGVTPMLMLLCTRGSLEPTAIISDPQQRTLLAQVLVEELGELELEQVEAALKSLRYRHLEALQRRMRANIADAERRGDQVQAIRLLAEKVKVDRQLQDVDA
jgi:DNA primase